MKRLLTYLGVTFAVTYACELTMLFNYDRILLLSSSPAPAVLAQLAVALMMLVPMLGVILTTLIFKDKFRDLPLKPRIKGNVKWYLAALFGPAALTLLGAGLYFALNPREFDPGMSAMAEVMLQSGAEAGMTMDTARLALIAQVLFAVALAPFINMIFAFGEEIGWRGYMMPRLCELMGVKKALLLGGVIWGLWHAPLIAMGHNYGMYYPGFPWLGIGAMCVFCVAIGCLFTWLCFKTESVWPAALAHGAMNAIAGVPALFLNKTDYDPFIGPLPTGIVGGAAVIALALFVFISFKGKVCLFPASVPEEKGE